MVSDVSLEWALVGGGISKHRGFDKKKYGDGAREKMVVIGTTGALKTANAFEYICFPIINFHNANYHICLKILKFEKPFTAQRVFAEGRQTTFGATGSTLRDGAGRSPGMTGFF